MGDEVDEVKEERASARYAPFDGVGHGDQRPVVGHVPDVGGGGPEALGEQAARSDFVDERLLDDERPVVPHERSVQDVRVRGADSPPGPRGGEATDRGAWSRRGTAPVTAGLASRRRTTPAPGPSRHRGRRMPAASPGSGGRRSPVDDRGVQRECAQVGYEVPDQRGHPGRVALPDGADLAGEVAGDADGQREDGGQRRARDGREEDGHGGDHEELDAHHARGRREGSGRADAASRRRHSSTRASTIAIATRFRSREKDRPRNRPRRYWVREAGLATTGRSTRRSMSPETREAPTNTAMSVPMAVAAESPRSDEDPVLLSDGELRDHQARQDDERSEDEQVHLHLAPEDLTQGDGSDGEDGSQGWLVSGTEGRCERFAAAWAREVRSDRGWPWNAPGRRSRGGVRRPEDRAESME